MTLLDPAAAAAAAQELYQQQQQQQQVVGPESAAGRLHQHLRSRASAQQDPTPFVQAGGVGAAASAYSQQDSLI
jgi:hypothetical protein